MCILIFSTTSISNISYPKKRSAIYCHKCENVFVWSICYSFQILKKIKLSRQTFEKKDEISNKFKIRPVAAKLFHADRQTDGHDEANSHFSKFFESA
jgi:hypothetical protein